jgi:hypothetical protein
MKLCNVIIIVLAASLAIIAQQPPVFDEFFIDRALRMDLSLIGDAKDQSVTLDKLVLEGIWPENPANLLEPFNNGRYAVKLYDQATNRLIYWRGFDTMFGEYRTTKPAIDGIRRRFSRSLHVPFPKKPVLLAIETRDKKNVLYPIFEQKIDPANVDIIRETVAAGDYVYEAVKSGDPHNCVDLAFLAEGYTAAEKDKFKADVDRFAGLLFSFEPYTGRKAKFNIYGIMRPSAESGMDEPRQGAYKKTVLNASFNAFGTDRYMLTEENRLAHEIAAEVPYDALVILVNSKRYGGGGIYNDYCITTADNARSPKVFIHEFGHLFAGLADEYYTSDVAYNDFYPKGVEPLEPNITALLDPAHLKWQDLVSPGVGIPTEYGKEEREKLELERRENTYAQAKELAQARQRAASDLELTGIQEKYTVNAKEIAAKIAGIGRKYSGLIGKVGAFEGAGYASKGLYRPAMYCIMISNPKNEFCPVCQRAIAAMISYYSGKY